MKKAILSTSQCRRDIWDGNLLVRSEPSELWTELTREGYEIFIASTRAKLDPEIDWFILDAIPAERIFCPNPELVSDYANSPGLIDMWNRALRAAGGTPTSAQTWIEVRAMAHWTNIRTR